MEELKKTINEFNPKGSWAITGNENFLMQDGMSNVWSRMDIISLRDYIYNQSQNSTHNQNYDDIATAFQNDDIRLNFWDSKNNQNTSTWTNRELGRLLSRNYLEFRDYIEIEKPYNSVPTGMVLLYPITFDSYIDGIRLITNPLEGSSGDYKGNIQIIENFGTPEQQITQEDFNIEMGDFQFAWEDINLHVSAGTVIFVNVTDNGGVKGGGLMINGYTLDKLD